MPIELSSLINRFIFKKKILNEFAIIIISQIFTTLVALYGVRVLTQYLGPSEYGILGLCLSITGVFDQLIFGPLSNYFSRFYSVYNERNNIVEYSGILLVVLKKILLYPFLVIISSLFIILQWNRSLIVVSILSVLFAYLSGVNGIFDSIQNAARDRLLVAFHQVGFIFLKIIFAIMLINLISANATVVLIGYILGGITIITSQFIFLKKNLNLKLATTA